MINVTISVKGIPETVGFLNKLKDKVKNPHGGMRKVGEFLLDLFSNKVFPSQGAAINMPWQSLAISTLREKNKKYPGRGILVRTGQLQKGFRMMGSSDYLKIYNVMPYGKFHMTGTRKMPMRQFVGVTDQQVGKVVGIILEDIIKSI